MPITVSTAYQRELMKGSNTPNTIIEVVLDNATYKWGYTTGGFPDVQPILESVSSIQNKVDFKSGFSTRGRLSFKISGAETIRRVVTGRYLKNRRITKKEGFWTDGFLYADYITTFTGKIVDYSFDGDVLTVVVADDLVEGRKKIPVENATKTQFLDYQNMNPVAIMQDMISTRMGISTVFIDSTKFTSEQNTWLSGWTFSRVITKPEYVDKYLSELQEESNSFLFHDGAKVSLKVFGPPVPNSQIQTYSDAQIQDGSFSMDAGFDDALFNRIVVYYDYNESGNDNPENFESIYITEDALSKSTAQWAETKTKEIKCKWIRTNKWTQPAVLTGITVYHVSYDNSTGAGTLTLATGATAASLSWKAPGSTLAGEAIKLNKSGQFQLFDSDTAKSIRVIASTASLATISTSEAVTITSVPGGSYAQFLGGRNLIRYRDPVASMKFKLDMNNAVHQGAYVLPTDSKFVSTENALTLDSSAFVDEPIFITSVRPDVEENTVAIEAVQSRLYRQYGFIAPAGFPTYTSASDIEKQYAFIADSSGKLAGSTANAYYIW